MVSPALATFPSICVWTEEVASKKANVVEETDDAATLLEPSMISARSETMEGRQNVLGIVTAVTEPVVEFPVMAIASLSDSVPVPRSPIKKFPEGDASTSPKRREEMDMVPLLNT
jgi:hypothetical protein